MPSSNAQRICSVSLRVHRKGDLIRKGGSWRMARGANTTLEIQEKWAWTWARSQHARVPRGAPCRRASFTRSRCTTSALQISFSVGPVGRCPARPLCSAPVKCNRKSDIADGVWERIRCLVPGAWCNYRLISQTLRGQRFRSPPPPRSDWYKRLLECIRQ